MNETLESVGMMCLDPFTTPEIRQQAYRILKAAVETHDNLTRQYSTRLLTPIRTQHRTDITPHSVDDLINMFNHLRKDHANLDALD
jgi:hypothetical protein